VKAGALAPEGVRARPAASVNIVNWAPLNKLTLFTQNEPGRAGGVSDPPGRIDGMRIKLWTNARIVSSARAIPYGNPQTLGLLLWTQMRGVLSHGHGMGPEPLREMYQASLRSVLRAAL
jgi:hypothetical protein